MKSIQKTISEHIPAVVMLLALVLVPMAVNAESDKPHHPLTFSEFDQDSDGFVSQAEFDAVRAARHEALAKEGRPMKGMSSAPAFSDIDTDGDGKLTEAELTAAHKAHMKAMHEEHAGMAAGEGMGMHGGGPHGKHHCNHGGTEEGWKMPTFEDLDLDGDGNISREEFAKHQAEMHKM